MSVDIKVPSSESKRPPNQLTKENFMKEQSTPFQMKLQPKLSVTAGNTVEAQKRVPIFQITTMAPFILPAVLGG